MTKEILEQLFDSPIKVRLLRLFMRNPGQSFTLREISKKIKADSAACQRQINKLKKIKLIKSRLKDHSRGYRINPDFVFYKELKTLILKSSPASKDKILTQLRKIGRVKLAVLSGIFTNVENSRADILIVGDHIQQSKLSRFFKELESEVGKEIDYVIFSTNDFRYRYDMFDRFLRDIFEKPHEKLINKLRV